MHYLKQVSQFSLTWIIIHGCGVFLSLLIVLLEEAPTLLGMGATFVVRCCSLSRVHLVNSSSTMRFSFGNTLRLL